MEWHSPDATMRALCSLSFLDQLLYLETTQPIDARLVGFHLSVAPVREFFQFLISGNFLKLLNLFLHLSLYLKKKHLHFCKRDTSSG